MDRVLAAPGRPLEPALRQDMEQSFGHDFSRVRVHSGAAAERSAQDVNAHAYTVGHNIVFDAGAFAPGTQRGRRLLAHELTHVVQQSRPDRAGQSRPTDAAESEAEAVGGAVAGMGRAGAFSSQAPARASITTGVQPGLLQRDKKGPDPARARVLAAMENLKKKFGLGEVSEEDGATWSESELAKVDAAFSKVSPQEQLLLKGLYLVRTSRLDPVVRKGKTFEVAGMTTGGRKIQLTRSAFQGNARTILHETGHVMHTRAAEEVLLNSKAKADLERARRRLEAAQAKAPRLGTEAQATFARSVAQVTSAASDLLMSGEEDLAARRSALDDAQMQAEMDRTAVEQQGDAAAKAWLEVHDRQRDWAAAVGTYMDEKGRKNLTAFVDLVKKHNLARKGFAPFKDYVAASWPDRPEEFFAESYAMWRSDPNYMKTYANPLYLWFERGDHLAPKVAPKTFRQIAREETPVIAELASEVEDTFLPVVQGTIELIAGPK
ncbi:MAG: DUF4157 domain-containing protein [Acidobacteriota bacterium]